MMTGKVVGLVFEIISKLDSYFLMTVLGATIFRLTASFFEKLIIVSFPDHN